jgi:hypothetical protein
MLVKIKRQDCLDKYPKFPLRQYDFVKDEEEYFYPRIFRSYVLTLDSKSLKGHTKLLASELSNLTKNLGLGSLIFLGDNKNYWMTKLSLGRNDYRVLEYAKQYFLDNKVDKNFNGALEVDNEELITFVKHFFCLVRCDASLPYFHFMDAGQNFVGSICQYGNLHFDTLNQKIDDQFIKALIESKFVNVEDRKCYSSFSKTSAIKTRQTKL